MRYFSKSCINENALASFADCNVRFCDNEAAANVFLLINYFVIALLEMNSKMKISIDF